MTQKKPWYSDLLGLFDQGTDESNTGHDRNQQRALMDLEKKTCPKCGFSNLVAVTQHHPEFGPRICRDHVRWYQYHYHTL